MYTPGLTEDSLFRKVGSARQGGVSELGVMPKGGLIRGACPRQGGGDGPEGLVSKPKIGVRPMAGKGWNQI